jgi:hypothetical protein
MCVNSFTTQLLVAVLCGAAGPIAANNIVTWSLLGLSEPADWPEDAAW